jgi:hypothetical protein
MGWMFEWELQHTVEVNFVIWVRGQQRGKERQDHEKDDEHQTKDGQSVVKKSARRIL